MGGKPGRRENYFLHPAQFTLRAVCSGSTATKVKVRVTEGK